MAFERRTPIELPPPPEVSDNASYKWNLPADSGIGKFDWGDVERTSGQNDLWELPPESGNGKFGWDALEASADDVGQIEPTDETGLEIRGNQRLKDLVLNAVDVDAGDAGSVATDDVKRTGEDKQDVTDKRMEPPVNISFRCPDSCDKKEYDRQVKGQENGLNNLTIGDFLRNRERYKENGRDTKEGTAAQQRAREEARADKIADFRKESMTREEAEKAADEWLKTQAALHDPDQIAGGNPDNVTGMGDSDVNSLIGAQWRGQAGKLEAAVRAYINENNISNEEIDNIKMNVNLSVE